VLQFNRKHVQKETGDRSLKRRKQYIKTKGVDWSWTGSWCGAVAGLYNTAWTSELSVSTKDKEFPESLSNYQFQLKDSIDLDTIFCVELSIILVFMRGGIVMSRYVFLVFVDCTAVERC
jgi:hypothetical protein